MAKVPLRYHGDNKLEAVTAAAKKALEGFNKDDNVQCDLTKYRSHKQNRAFFAAIAKAWDNSPRQEEWPQGPEELRGWLFVEVGFHDTVEIAIKHDKNDLKRILNLVAALRHLKLEHHAYIRIRETSDSLAIDIPKSWQFKKTEHKQATEIMNKVLDVLIADVVPGVTRKQLLKAVEKDPT